MIHKPEMNARILSWRAALLSACLLSSVLLVWGGLSFHSLALIGGGALLLVGALLAGWFVLFVRYEINRFELVVRRGPYRLRIPLECISGVQPARRSVTAPPWRPVKLCIGYRKGERDRIAHLSPEHRRAFVRELASAAPWLEIMGDRLVRTPQVRQAL
jgi:hypothetical protein